MQEEPLFSICIPTFQRAEILKETLDSIYAQELDHTLFEVCISDNSPTTETEDLLREYFPAVDNLRYSKSACKGFLNSIEALKLGRGKFLKLHNDYSVLKPNALLGMLEKVKEYERSQAVLFFSMDTLGFNDVRVFDTFNDFLGCVNYFSTWSSAFAVWKVDFEKFMESKSEINYMYPHTSILYYLVDKEQYVVDDTAYAINRTPKKKGGYNLIDNFVRIYLGMTHKLVEDGHITEETYNAIVRGIIRFCGLWNALVKADDRYTFTFDNDTEIIKNTCGSSYVWKYKFWCAAYGFKQFLKKVLLRS
ncbi:MAG: glycosyltransferase family 2 protein [Phascolarctobacterium sp.]|nr:glycosyltransferase family 2 protein [Phascolarctobacterium sp.]